MKMNNLLNILPFMETDEEILLLVSNKKSVDKQCKEFNFDKLSEDFCKEHFRFSKEHILTLKRLLLIPEKIICDSRNISTGLEGLCVLLKRLSYPNRYVDMMHYFPRTKCELSRIFNWVVEFLIRTHGHRLQSFDQPWLLQNLQYFSNRVKAKGSPYENCFGFLDGTVRPICRPSRNQKMFYNGHKRTHAIKFQSVIHPNGLISQLHGPVTGRRHDAHLLARSGILDHCENNFNTPDGKPYYLYGDPAYPLRKHLIVPFKGQNLTPNQRKCNKIMSKLRVTVEWGFAKILQEFAFLDYKKNLKLLMQPVGNYYLIATLLSNCHSCIYGNEIATYFDCEIPSIEEYLS